MMIDRRTFLVCSAGWRRTPTLADLTPFVRHLDEMGAEVKKAGMAPADHDHDFDAVRIDGVPALDRPIGAVA